MTSRPSQNSASEDVRVEREGGAAATAVGAAVDLRRRNLGEPVLGEVEPRARGRDEVEDEARMREQPFPDRRGVVCRGGVEHEVELELGRDFELEPLQEPLELDRAV